MSERRMQKEIDALLEKARQAGYREGIEAAAQLFIGKAEAMEDKFRSQFPNGVQSTWREIAAQVRALLPQETEDSSSLIPKEGEIIG